ncbi:T9SS C-terminal target domain-containing protein, partial [Xanthomarina sp. F1114]|nr:T9SS C-terminal target domain-containing protein [Xanthomarina sp. F1114]
MKKTTLALASALFTFGMQAQTFPSPYCDITDSAEVIVEEITNVTFAGTSMVNADATTVLIDETATIVNLDVGETYTVSVEGDT